MANFKVGQAVRVIRTIHRDAEHCLGQVGRIAPDGNDPPSPGWHNVTLSIPNAGGWDSWERPGWEFPSWCLEPLTDPRAQQFVEDMERFSRVTRKVPQGDEQPTLREVFNYYREIAD